MPVIYQDIASCESDTLDLSLKSFAEGGAETFAEAFKEKKSITRLLLSDADIVDKEFEIIAQAILDRNIPLMLLDLDYNDLLTLNSMPLLVSLIEKNLIKHLSIYCVKELVNSRDCYNQFADMANRDIVTVFNLNPIDKNKQYPTLFNPRPANTSAKNVSNDKFEEERDKAGSSTIHGARLTNR